MTEPYNHDSFSDPPLRAEVPHRAHSRGANALTDPRNRQLLIIAGPYEADRIRRAAVAAHFETVAVEPGESLSGWISATFNRKPR